MHYNSNSAYYIMVRLTIEKCNSLTAIKIVLFLS